MSFIISMNSAINIYLPMVVVTSYIATGYALMNHEPPLFLHDDVNIFAYTAARCVGNGIMCGLFWPITIPKYLGKYLKSDL